MAAAAAYGVGGAGGGRGPGTGAGGGGGGAAAEISVDFKTLYAKVFGNPPWATGGRSQAEVGRTMQSLDRLLEDRK